MLVPIIVHNSGNVKNEKYLQNPEIMVNLNLPKHSPIPRVGDDIIFRVTTRDNSATDYLGIILAVRWLSNNDQNEDEYDTLTPVLYIEEEPRIIGRGQSKRQLT